MLHHLALTATDLPASGKFYDRVLAPLGYKRHLSKQNLYTWHGCTPELLIYRGKQNQLANTHKTYDPGIHHIAFAVKHRAIVDKVYESLLEINAKVLDPPKEYPQYCAGYYAVYFLDPDGIKLEVAVTSEP